MSESTLSLKKTDLEGMVGLFLGWGRGGDNGDTAWNTAQTAAVNDIVRSALRQFYFPAPLGMSGFYSWSFLKPQASLILTQGERTLELPDDFGGFEGEVILTNADSLGAWTVPVVNLGVIDGRFSRFPDAAGQPECVAVAPQKGTTNQAGQRFDMHFYPQADQEYQVKVCYYVLPDALDGGRPYAYGGMAHTETIRAACLMAAEESLDDEQTLWAQKFQQRLAASIAFDMKQKPQALGYNGDRSDERLVDSRWRRCPNPVAFNGVIY